MTVAFIALFSVLWYILDYTFGASKRSSTRIQALLERTKLHYLSFRIFMLVYTTMPSASSPLRVAILECDTPIGRTKEKYGGYGNLFKELLHKGVDDVREKDGVEVPELDVRKYDVVNDELYPKLEDVDAVLLSGSREFCRLF